MSPYSISALFEIPESLLKSFFFLFLFSWDVNRHTAVIALIKQKRPNKIYYMMVGVVSVREVVVRVWVIMWKGFYKLSSIDG